MSEIEKSLSEIVLQTVSSVTLMLDSAKKAGFLVYQV